jgi:hypothetical protein
MVGEIDVGHVPFTRVCVTMMLSGVPFGAHIDWLSCMRIGMPPAFTRVAAVTHVAVTQGEGADATLKGQPEIVNMQSWLITI